MEVDFTCWGKCTLGWTEPRYLRADALRDLPTVPGVYTLMTFSLASPEYLVCYVGQSDDVAQRLHEHASAPEALLAELPLGVHTYFTVALVVDPLLRTAAQAALVRLLKPIGNHSVPEVFPIVVNPPEGCRIERIVA